MATGPRIAFIGAGSTVFMKNIVGDILQRPALADAHFALMDIDEGRLDESALVAGKIISTLKTAATVSTHTDRREALSGADFVIVAFQIGGYEPCTITDFEIPRSFGLRQTIADTLGVGGIMRGLRTVPPLGAVCEDILAVCPDALMLQYVNPMAINTWAIEARYPQIKQVGLCHSVQGTAEELAHDLDLDVNTLKYRVGGINHMAFFLELEERRADGSTRDLYPDLHRAYAEGRAPKPNRMQPRCENRVRYEMLNRLGYFVTESSEHFSEYVPYFIKDGRPDLIEKFQVPLDEYPKRCIEQVEAWNAQAQAFRDAETIEVEASHEYASEIINAMWTDSPAVIYGNTRNAGYISNLPEGCAVEVPCLVDANGVQPTAIGDLPKQLVGLIRTNISVQEMTVEALMTENREHIYHAAMLDPHTAAELDLDQIWALTDALIAGHGEWLPDWCHGPAKAIAA